MQNASLPQMNPSRAQSKPVTRPPAIVVPPSPHQSWADIQEEDEKHPPAWCANATPAPVSTSLVPKTGIPRHLLNATRMKTRNGTRPVGGRGGKLRYRQPGIRNMTVGHVADYGLKAWQLAKHLATLVNVEDKKFDVDGSAGSTIGTTATIVNLSNIAQGNDYNNRSGDSILGQAMEFRAFSQSNPAAIAESLRVMIVCDHENHGADIVIGDVLQGGSMPSVQPINATSANRFEILYDELVHFSSPAAGLATTGTSTTYCIDRQALPVLTRKWNKHIKYSSSAGADASNWENALFLVAISDNNSAPPSLYYTFRLHYTDN